MTFLQSLFPDLEPMSLAGIGVTVVVFVWLFKEFKNSFTKSQEIREDRIDKTMEAYALCLSYIEKSKNKNALDQESSKELIIDSFSKVMPYINRKLFLAIEKCRNNYREETVNEVYRLIENELSQLNIKRNGHNDLNSDSTLSLFTRILHPLYNIVGALLVTVGLSVYLFYIIIMYSAYEGDMLGTLTSVFAPTILMFCLMFIFDLGYSKRLKLTIRNGIAIPLIFIPTIVVLAIPTVLITVISTILLIVGIYALDVVKYGLKTKSDDSITLSLDTADRSTQDSNA